jgi:hypothetical protein
MCSPIGDSRKFRREATREERLAAEERRVRRLNTLTAITLLKLIIAIAILCKHLA